MDPARKVLDTLMMGWALPHPFVFYLFSPGMRETREAKNFFVGAAVSVGVPGIAYMVTVSLTEYR